MAELNLYDSGSQEEVMRWCQTYIPLSLSAERLRSSVRGKKSSKLVYLTNAGCRLNSLGFGLRAKSADQYWFHKYGHITVSLNSP